MSDHLTGEQIRAVVTEIAALETHAIDVLGWHIEVVNHLYYLPVEAYLVSFQHGDHPMEPVLYVREDGKLTPRSGWSYYASNNFEDVHMSPEQVRTMLREQTSAPESEGDHDRSHA